VCGELTIVLKACALECCVDELFAHWLTERRRGEKMKGKNKAVVTLSVHFGMHGVHSGMHFGMHGVHFGMHFGMHGVHNGIGGITRGLQPGILTERMCTLASSWAARCVGGSKRRCRCWSCLSILRRAEDNPTLDKRELMQCIILYAPKLFLAWMYLSCLAYSLST